MRPGQLFQEKQFYIADFGASPDASPLQNTEAFQTAIKEAALSGGGTVVVPAGHYLVYTILLKSNVNLYLEEGAVVAAARTDIVHSYEKQTGEGGNHTRNRKSIPILVCRTTDTPTLPTASCTARIWKIS